MALFRLVWLGNYMPKLHLGYEECGIGGLRISLDHLMTFNVHRISTRGRFRFSPRSESFLQFGPALTKWPDKLHSSTSPSTSLPVLNGFPGAWLFDTTIYQTLRTTSPSNEAAKQLLHGSSWLQTSMRTLLLAKWRLSATKQFLRHSTDIRFSTSMFYKLTCATPSGRPGLCCSQRKITRSRRR